MLTNFPDRESAEQLARRLVERRLAACVNVLAECTSIYRWEGKLENAREVPMLIKTTSARYSEIEREIKAVHPYELPEIVAVPIAAGLQRYLDWVEDESCAG